MDAHLREYAGAGRSIAFAVLLTAVALASGACVTQPADGEPGAAQTQGVGTATDAPTGIPLVLETPSPISTTDVVPAVEASPTVESTPKTSPTAKPTPPPTKRPTAAPTANDPYAAAKAAGATAICADGTWSYSAHRSGTCSGHGGVHWWTGNVGAAGPGGH